MKNTKNLTLPLELVLEILLLIFMDGLHKPHENFHRLSLVCKTWRPYAQRLLFRNVRLHDPDATRGFLVATRPDAISELSQTLGESVRSVEMTLRSQDMLSLFSFVLRHCPKLRELSLVLYKDIDLGSLSILSATLPQLPNVGYAELALPSIRALRISAMVEVPRFLKSAFITWPTIRHLGLADTALEQFSTHMIPESGAPGTKLPLYEVDFGPSRRGRRDPSECIRRLLQTCGQELRILDLRGLGNATAIQNFLRESVFLAQHGAQIRSLRLAELPLHAKVHGLKACTGLEELVLYGQPPSVMREVLPLDCLVHFLYAHTPSQESYSVDRLVKWCETMPKLEVFTYVTRGQGGVIAEDAKKLASFCNAKGVRFRHKRNGINELREELIEPTTFPRDEIITAVWR